MPCCAALRVRGHVEIRLRLGAVREGATEAVVRSVAALRRMPLRSMMVNARTNNPGSSVLG